MLSSFDTMPLSPTWPEILLRLALAMLAGAAIGIDRGERGHSTGLRTTILVTLAATIAMLQANVLLAVGGKQQDSFGVMDLMRMPLGILTGIGFIGAGAIIKRGDIVSGVTTAATIWIMTVVGLCFGGGQLGLGIAGTALTWFTLRVVRWLDVRIPRDQHGILVVAGGGTAMIKEVTERLAALGFRTRLERQSAVPEGAGVRLSFDVSWRRAALAGPPLDLLQLLNERFPGASLDITARGHPYP
ncbi:MAG TPA: MgtC/SapB family protein [Candidatus Binataceae bacterium]|nr:MgtC/SapB family protein [Candidatus Binataceae bacterium]